MGRSLPCLWPGLPFEAMKLLDYRQPDLLADAILLEVNEQFGQARDRPGLIELADLPDPLLVGQLQDPQQLPAHLPWVEGHGYVKALVEDVGIHHFLNRCLRRANLGRWCPIRASLVSRGDGAGWCPESEGAGGSPPEVRLDRSSGLVPDVERDVIVRCGFLS